MVVTQMEKRMKRFLTITVIVSDCMYSYNITNWKVPVFLYFSSKN